MDTYSRIIPDADTALLFIHGILGTPKHFEAFLPLVPECVSMVNICLDGHGKGVREFARTSMEKWEDQVDAQVDALLKNHRNVYLVGHSLGTLLAIEQAVKKPIAGLFLLAVPIQLRLKPRIVSTSWKLYVGKNENPDPYILAAQNCCGVQLEKNPFPYLGWIPRFWELFVKIREVRNLLPLLRTPCRVYQSRQDELVGKGSAAYLQQYNVMDVKVLEHSSHYYYDPQDQAAMLQGFRKDDNRSGN